MTDIAPNSNNAVNSAMRKAKQDKFLEVYSRHGIVGPGIQAAGVSRKTYNRWRQDDEVFDAACEDALEDAIDLAEIALRERAVDGIEEVVLHKGEPVWKRDPATGSVMVDDNFDPIPFTVPKRSDRLLEVYMIANRAKYKPKADLALSGPNGGPLRIQSTIEFVSPAPQPAESSDGNTES